MRHRVLLIIIVVTSTVSVTAAPRAALAGIRDGEDEKLVNKRDEEVYDDDDDDDDEEISVVDVDDHKSKRDEPRTLSTFLTYRLSLVGLGLR